MRHSRDRSRLLRWYPRAWRDRYGEELLALIEDTANGGRSNRGWALAIARAGLIERARAGGWVGTSVPPRTRVRAGALLVLCAWTGLVIAGAAFAKVSEHFEATGPTSSSTSATAWRTVEMAAVATAVAVLIGGVIAIPAMRRALRDSRCRDLRGCVVRAVATTSTATAATGGVVAWAHTLPAAARENAHGTYAWAFIGSAVALALCLASWTCVAVGVARRATFTRAELALEALLALAVTGGMAVVTVATTLWWRAILTDAPSFLHDASSGTFGVDIRLLTIVVVMFLALAVACYGAVRITRSWAEPAAA